MRKKELINQNNALVEELNALKRENSTLMEELAKKTDEIESLKRKIFELELKLQKTVEETEEPEAEIQPQEDEENIFDYGAVIIGKVIISAAEYIGRIETDDEERAAEAKTTILDRTETVKAEILEIISSDDSYNTKSQLMEREYHSAVSYFDRTVSRL